MIPQPLWKMFTSQLFYVSRTWLYIPPSPFFAPLIWSAVPQWVINTIVYAFMDSAISATLRSQPAHEGEEGWLYHCNYFALCTFPVAASATSAALSHVPSLPPSLMPPADAQLGMGSRWQVSVERHG